MADLVRGRRPRHAEPPSEDRAAAEPFEALPLAGDASRRAVATTAELLRSRRARTPVSMAALAGPLEALLESVRTSDVLLLPFFNPGGGSADPAERAVNACVLSMKIGTQLDYTSDALLELGLAALLHEAGVGRTATDDAQIVQGLRARHGRAAAVLAQLREPAHGSGTHDAEDTEIREHAHIVSLVEIIEGLVRDQAFRSGFGHSEVIKEVLKRERRTYPHKILTVLIRILATLPVGSLVRLNTGEICRVAAKNGGFPLRPTVVVLVRARKRLAEPQTIDLSQHPFLQIQEFVSEQMLTREAEASAP